MERIGVGRDASILLPLSFVVNMVFVISIMMPLSSRAVNSVFIHEVWEFESQGRGSVTTTSHTWLSRCPISEIRLSNQCPLSKWFRGAAHDDGDTRPDPTDWRLLHLCQPVTLYLSNSTSTKDGTPLDQNHRTNTWENEGHKHTPRRFSDGQTIANLCNY